MVLFQRAQGPLVAVRKFAPSYGALFQRAQGPLPVISLVTLALASACSGGESPTVPGEPTAVDIDLSRPWQKASPSDVGGSASLIEEGLERAATNHRLRSMLVVKDGLLVVEEYFGVGHTDSLNDVRSVTKSVVSALTGIVLESGEIASVDDQIGQYLHSELGGIPEDKSTITVRHLLTMTGGFAWDETGGFGDYRTWLRSDDPVRYLLDKRLVTEPGTVFNYNSAAVHLLGMVLEEATGQSLPTLANERLFAPIGISEARWEAVTGGYHNGGAGIDLRARDLARFGQLFLQRGSSGGTQVIPAEWVNASIAPRFTWRTSLSSLTGISYGFLWWVVPDIRYPLYFAWGYGGQFVAVAPNLNVVVVATNEWRGVTGDGGARVHEEMTMKVIAEHFIPAFR